MASSRISLNSPDWRDAATSVLAIGKMLGGRVDIRVKLGGSEGRPTITLIGEVLETDPDHQVLRCLASASVRVDTTTGMDLPTALLSLSYELDRDAYLRSQRRSVKQA